jgi:phage I-like protein
MTTRDATALCQAIGLPAGKDGGAPDWIHLLPAGGVIATADTRGPYTVPNVDAIIGVALQAAGGRLPIDENHSTDLAAPNGWPAPARGWVVALEKRDDGVWGKVEWTDEGARLVSSRAYRSISPVITHDRTNRVTGLLRASLVNKPNLRGLTALHSEQEETDMDFLAKLRSALGLKDDADEAAILSAIGGRKDETAVQTALQAQLAPIAKAVGLKDDSAADAVLLAIGTLKKADTDVVTALQSELKTVTTQFTALQTEIATGKATTFVDGAIKAGRVGVKPLRDHYIAMHAQDAARVEKEINAMPILGPSGAQITPPAKDGEIALNAEQMQASKVLGIAPAEYLKTLQAEQAARL